jgi:xyloglucan-specific exo-beta-1,4-glucanase
MKKITTLAMLLLAGICGHAQFSYETLDDYGRLEGITYDLDVEDKLYAVSLNNHIVVSYDNGETWDLLYAYPNTGARITNLRLLPGNENLCFSIINLYTEEDGIYVLNIEDNEIVSSFDPPVLEGLTITNFDIYDSEATTIILNVYTNAGGKVFYTTTGGENWTEIYDVAENNNVSVKNVAFSPDNPAKLFIARGQGTTAIDGGLLISTDSGETWTEKLAGIPVNAIDFNPTDVNDILLGGDVNYSDAVDENLYRSTDGGDTWAVVPVTWSPDAPFDNLLVVKFHPEQDNVIYVLETNEIAYTEDGGATWLNTVYPEDVYYGGQHISLNPFDTKEAVITANMYPVRTTNGGAALTQVKAPFCVVNSVSAVKFGTTEHLYYGAQGGRLHKNYATNMTDAYDIESPASFSPSANTIIADPLNEGRIFMAEGGGFLGGNLYVSADHGATRTMLMSASRFTGLAVNPDNENIVYVALDEWGMGSLNKLDITDLGAVVQTPITTPGDGPIGGILSYPNLLVLAKNSTVYRSIDDGANWTELYTVEGAIIAGLSPNPLNGNGFGIATSNGVYTTADAGVTWTEALEGVDARKVQFSDLTDGVMAIGVYNGIDTTDAYITYFNGEDWMTVTSEEMNYLQSYAMDFTFVGDNINAYIGTVDMGIIRYSFPIETLGVNDPSKGQDKVVLAPNPASDIVTVHTSQLSAIKNVAIYNITGQKVLESAQPQVNISHLSKGVYVVKAETTSGAVTSSKLVKE